MTRWNATLLRAGTFRLDAGCMFGLIPKVVWSKWFAPGVIDDLNRMPMEQNCLLLESGGRLAVIETGIGDKFDAKQRGIYAQQPRAVHDALAERGVDPSQVEDVVCTHLHFDHAGGLTRAAGGDPNAPPALTFPRARVHAQATEWRDALANKSTMHATYLRSHINDAVAARMVLAEGEREVVPGVTVMPTPGHTWGQQCVRVALADGRTLVFVSDVVPTALHARPTTNLAYDVEPYTSMLERQKLLKAACENRWILLLDHEPGHPVFSVEADREKSGHFVLRTAEL
ncbi:MAG: MBL fold metallo-hydrolase [Phycisphaerales bacterium]|nr:MBL fold metallo-hydrolase [Phycisphaerales bacterium]